MELIQQERARISESANDTNAVRSLQNLTWEYQYIDLDSARYWGEWAVRLADQLKHPKFRFLAHYKLTFVLAELGELAEARKHAETVLEMAQQPEVEYLKSSALVLMGVVYDRLNLYEEALEAYKSALLVSQATGDSIDMAFTAVNIGVLYYGQNDLLAAYDYHRQALVIFQRLRDTAELSTSYLNLSTCETDRSGIYLDSAQFYAELAQRPDLIAKVLSNRAAACHKADQNKKAIGLWNAALLLYQNLEAYYELAPVYNALASAYAGEGQTDSALYLARKAYQIASDLDYGEEVSDALYAMYEAYAAEKRYDSALHYYALQVELRDSLFSLERAAKLAQIEARYEVAKTQEELALNQLELSETRNLRNIAFLGTLILMVVGSLVFFRLRHRQREKHRQAEFELQQSEQQRKQLQEIHDIKSTFFANISHEFRTPLTLLLSPLRAMQSDTLKGNQRHYLNGMIRNAERLLGLINQLLEMARLEKGELPLNPEDRYLLTDLRLMTEAFRSLAEDHQIDYQVSLSEHDTRWRYDREKLEQVVTNLLSNAFKFTPDGGRVSFKATIEHNLLRFEVMDQGQGIPPADLPHIFDRFYRVNQPGLAVEGTGLGLALVKDLVDVMHGEISVISEATKGTSFSIALPLKEPLGEIPTEKPMVPPSQRPLNDASRILVVEDNPEMIRFLKEQLGEDHQILTASNGREGWEVAREQIPDLVLTDVMMPELNGLELCKIIKETPATSHIPVVLLTALSDQNRKLEGLEAAADHYLAKPFDLEELRLILRNMLEQQKRVTERIQENGLLVVKQLELPSMEEAFLQKVWATIENHFNDEAFSVEGLAAAVGMSRSQLHRKLKALTGKTPSQFIRSFRLLHARNLLEKEATNVSEAAYLSGFSSQAYFSRCFSEEFGFAPSDL
ncbi:MAG: ATP-binding protein [Salibacteraceae bacterium]